MIRSGLLASVLLAGCGGGDTTMAQPACDSSEVVASLRGIADTHPGYQPRLPGRTVAITDIRETRKGDVPEEGRGAYERLCFGTIEYAGGVKAGLGWRIFTDASIFGPVWSVTPCFDGYDPEGSDCSVFGEGRLPGEAP